MEVMPMTQLLLSRSGSQWATKVTGNVLTVSMFLLSLTLAGLASPIPQKVQNREAQRHPLTGSHTQKRVYHPYTIAQLTAEDPLNWKHPLTHFQTGGWVTYRAHESDRDWHIRLCDDPKLSKMDAKHCIIPQRIPQTPLAPPRLPPPTHVQRNYPWGRE